LAPPEKWRGAIEVGRGTETGRWGGRKSYGKRRYKAEGLWGNTGGGGEGEVRVKKVDGVERRKWGGGGG